MSLYLSLPLLVSVALVQNAWLSRVSLWGARPNLMFLVVLGWAVVRGVDEALIWAFVGGLTLDLVSAGPLGGHVLALLAVAFVGSRSWGEGLGAPLGRLLLLALVSGVVFHLALLVALAWTGRVVDWRYALLQVTMPSIVLNVVLAPLVRQPLAWLGRRLQGDRFGR